MVKKKIYYLAPLIIAILLFSSNFLNTQLFGSETINFVVWFILSLFVFVTGWFLNNILGWVHGGKIVFAVIVATTILSIILVSIFSNYFLTENMLFENIILYSLRNIMLGAISIFGMTVSELITLQREIEKIKSNNENILVANKKNDKDNLDSFKNLPSDKIFMESQKILNEIQNQKEILEQKLDEFIEFEKNMLNKLNSEKNKIS